MWSAARSDRQSKSPRLPKTDTFTAVMFLKASAGAAHKSPRDRRTSAPALIVKDDAMTFGKGLQIWREIVHVEPGPSVKGDDGRAVSVLADIQTNALSNRHKRLGRACEHARQQHGRNHHAST